MTQRQNWSETARLYIEKAHAALREARNNQNLNPNVAISRAYYSTFYMAQAALATREENPRGHDGVHHRFSFHFVRTGLIAQEMLKILTQLIQSRIKADYDIKTFYNTEDAIRRIEMAENFTETIEAMLTKESFLFSAEKPADEM
ncbi:MAG: HEPN domain-containing protein [Synergistaceae bacterium]|jgi:uncharacterized protein (UPF0332 family)|nr:HEPN domain-containing protein [Synergistaceae bacterium]